METLSLSQEMLHYFEQLNEAEKKSVLQLAKTISDSKKENFAPQTIEEYNQELEQADSEIEAGDYVSHEEVLKQYLKS